MLDKPCPFKRTCEDYRRATMILNATRKNAMTIAEISTKIGLSGITVRRICYRLVELGYLDEVHKTVSARGRRFGKSYARGAKAYINRW